MIAVDSNMLVYGHRRDSAWHEQASVLLKELAEGSAPWLIPWPCIHEFLSVVTHPRIYNPPSTMHDAMAQVHALLESRWLVVASETEDYWEVLQQTLREGKITGPMVHDARVATICKCHGVQTVWTADRDFSRFKGIKAINPLIRS